LIKKVLTLAVLFYLLKIEKSNFKLDNVCLVDQLLKKD